jgi:hypothetical protein
VKRRSPTIRHGEYFGYFILRATGLLVFVRVRTFHICGRLRGRKRNLREGIARSRVLTSVRPLMRPFTCRGPVWEFADRVQITATRSRRSVKNWLTDSVSHRLCAILSFRPSYVFDAS